MEALLHGEKETTSLTQESRTSKDPDRNPPSTVVQTNCDFVSSSIARLGDFLGVHLLEQSMVPLSPPETDTSVEYLPSYFRPFPAHLEPSDIEYARSKGAFCVPQDSFRSEIIRSYLAYVHWYLPVVDIDELLQLENRETAGHTTSGYSLLLFQCIMFAAVGFVKESTVKEAGYESLRVARKAFYHKARLLYDLEFEQNGLVLVQCLLLMSLWSEKPDGHKEAWYWAGIACSVAQTCRLYQNPDNLPMSPTEKRLRRRVWWCCFLRDRLISLGIGRPMRIRDDEYDVPLLTFQDFETEMALQQPNLLGDGQTACEGIIPWDQTVAEQLAEIFIAKLKLCKTVGSILSTQYTILERGSRSLKRDAGSFFSVLLFAIPNRASDRTTDDKDKSFERFEAELTEWKDTLSPPLQLSQLRRSFVAADEAHVGVHTAQGLQYDDDPEPPLCMLLQCSLLHMCYHAAVSILHRPRSASALSKAKLSTSANEVASFCSLLNAKGLASFLPTNVTPMIMASIASNALLVKLTALRSISYRYSVEQKRQEVEKARDNVSELLVTLNTLRLVYLSSDSVWTLVEALLARLGLRIVACARLGHATIDQKSSHRAFELDFIRNPTDVHEQGFAAPTNKSPPSQRTMDAASGNQIISPPLDLPSIQLGASLYGDTRLLDTPATSVDTQACHSTNTDETTWDSLLKTLNYDGSVPTQIAVDWDGMDWSGTDWETLDLDWPS
ncbi:hypothetical protein H2200_005139 [Cladophialophora chaetospira]|uniref:Xylanolytic transcriptional activator regulatory domain-containing protein n=1 Tax=Cladophialophora chaetospira TaxID=386627 RepID=A0AA38XBJ3_9EURO|nr:hypothetical protein H2200_005139 [Cladophialophora chaetospira]